MPISVTYQVITSIRIRGAEPPPVGMIQVHPLIIGCQKVPYWTDPIFVKEPLKKFHGHQPDIHNSYMTGTSGGIH